MIINPYLVQPSGPSYGTLTTAWIAATGETDLTILGALNTLETDLTTYGLTAKIKALYPFVGGTAGKHKFNFMDARDLNAAFRLVFNGGITHSANGVQFGGVNGWAETNLTTSSVLSQNSTHLSLYSRTNNGTAVVDISGDAGVQDGTPKMYINFGGTNTYFSVNQASNSIVADGSSSGMRLISRINSTNEKLYKNGSVLLNSAQTSAAFGPSNTIQISNYAGSYRSNREYALASIGTGLTDTESANFYTAVQRFQTTLGRQVGTPIPFALPLDTYSGAAVAYSAARRLRTAYTGSLIRVRRSSDNAEQDIGYTAGNVLDEAALTAFVGAGNGFITTWYDQSGNGKNQTQSTAANQPRIVNSGVIEKIGTIPTINFVTNTWMRNSSNINIKSIFTLSQVNTYTQLQSLITFSLFSTGPWIRSINPNYYRAVSTGGLNTDDYTNANDMYFNDHLHITSDNFLNKHILSSFGNTTSAFAFSDPLYGRFYLGKISEGITYSTDEKSGYRTGIVGNMNTFYTVY